MAIEKEYVTLTKSQAENLPVAADESNLGTSMVLKFKSKMAVVTSKDLIFQASPGSST